MVKKKIKKIKDEDLIKDTAQKLFELLGTTATSSVTFDKENDLYLLDVAAGDVSGLLIGKKGETINSIQTIINQIIRQKKGEWVRVVVNVADFREKEKSRMEELAYQTAQRVRETGEPQNLYNLTPAQRRVVHMALSLEKDLQTESVGEGLERYLIVSKK